MQVPTGKDLGKMVMVRDRDDSAWKGPFELQGVRVPVTRYPYIADDNGWAYAKLVDEEQGEDRTAPDVRGEGERTMNKQNEIEKLKNDIEAVETHLRETLKMTEQGVEETMDMLRNRVDALEAKVPKSEPEPDLTPRPGDEGCWVMVWDDNRRERGPYLLREVVPGSVPYMYSSREGWWKNARIVPGPMRGMLQKHDGTPNKPQWLDNSDFVIFCCKGPYGVRTARHVPWIDVRRYQKLEVK